MASQPIFRRIDHEREFDTNWDVSSAASCFSGYRSVRRSCQLRGDTFKPGLCSNVCYDLSSVWGRPNHLRSCRDTRLLKWKLADDFTPQTFPAFVFTGGQEAGAPDPFVGFSFGVVNTTTGDLTFTYSFTTPFVGGPYTMAQTIFVDSLINTAFSGTESVTPNGDPYIMESDVNSVHSRLRPGNRLHDSTIAAFLLSERGHWRNWTGALFFCRVGQSDGFGILHFDAQHAVHADWTDRIARTGAGAWNVGAAWFRGFGAGGNSAPETDLALRAQG